MCVCVFQLVCTQAETVARRSRPCGKTEFTCSNQRCIPMQLQCDLFNDCGDDGSDEQDCKARKCGVSWLEQTSKRHWGEIKRCQGSAHCYLRRLIFPGYYDIYGNVCVRTVEYPLWKTGAPSWVFLHIKGKTQQVSRMQKGLRLSCLFF